MLQKYAKLLKDKKNIYIHIYTHIHICRDRNREVEKYFQEVAESREQAETKTSAKKWQKHKNNKMLRGQRRGKERRKAEGRRQQMEEHHLC